MATQGGPALTARSIGRRLYPVLPQEAGAVIVRIHVKPGNPFRYGAAGDGVTVDTVAVQTALNVGMLGVPVRFDLGTFLVDQLHIKWGMRIGGQGPLTVLKLLPNSTQSQRIFTTQNNGYSAAVDSPVLHISSLTFDMNRSNQGAYLGSQKEQQHGIFLNAIGTGGRLRARITDCAFLEGCADGIAVYSNVDLTVTNSFFFNLFRSSISVLGGYNKLRVVNCRGAGDVHPSTFQAETQASTDGYLGSLALDLQMVNCDWDAGMDIAVGAASTIYIENTHFRGSNVCYWTGNGEDDPALPMSKFTFVGGSLVIGGATNSYRFYRYGNTKFVGTRITWKNAAALHSAFLQPGIHTNQSVDFIGCDFNGDDSFHTATPVAGSSTSWAAGLLTVNTAAPHGVSAGGFVALENWTTTAVNGVYRVDSVTDADTFVVVMPRTPGVVTVGSGTTRLRSGLYAMSSSADAAASNNRVNFVDCRFGARIDVCHWMQQGGKVVMRNMHTEAGMLAYIGAGASIFFDVRIGQFTFGDAFRHCMQVVGSVAGCVLWHEGTRIPVEVSGFSRSSNLTGLTVLGNRVIYGAGAPAASDPALKGDEYRRTDPAASTAFQYIAVTSAQSGASSTWKASTTLAA